MSYHRSIEPRDAIDGQPCVHFRSKAMCVNGGLEPQEIDHRHNHDQNCWCNITQHVLGPDQQLVQLRDCSAGRECFAKV